MGKIVKDDRYANTIWCLCNNYEEYIQFAKDLWEYKETDSFFGGEYFTIDEKWFEDEFEWMGILGIPVIEEPVPDEPGMVYEFHVDPIHGRYEIKEKPREEEYPIVIMYDHHQGVLTWVSLNKLRK